jgi:hypothetical protein
VRPCGILRALSGGRGTERFIGVADCDCDGTEWFIGEDEGIERFMVEAEGELIVLPSGGRGTLPREVIVP